MIQRETRVLMTGASGFIGQHVVQKLKAAGAELQALSTQPLLAESMLGVTAHDIHELRTDSTFALLEAFSPDVFLHLGWAGIPDYSMQMSLENLATGVALLGLASQLKVGRIVAAGSCWEYGSARGELKENQKDRPNTAFSKAKSHLRDVFESVAVDSGMEYRWARIFYAYGPGQRKESLIPMSIDAIKNGQTPQLRDTRSAIDLVHVDDVAHAIAKLSLEKGPSGIFNVGSGKAYKVSDVVELVRESIMDGPVSEKERMSDTSFASWANLEKIGRDYQWSPKVSIEDGVRSML